jgi:hypothetical protein
MTKKKFLSNKKTAQQTISISPALKDWIKRYVNVNNKHDPDDERFRSISAFYNYILEKIMDLFQKGKTLNDFERVEDKGVKDFFEPFTFKATIPLYEMVAESNRYTRFSFDFTTRFLLNYSNWLRKQFRPGNFEDLSLLFERIRSRYGTSNVSTDMRLEIIPGKGNHPTRGILEFIGKQRNLHYENCKFFAAIFGMLGIRVTDFTYDLDNYYGRIDLIETELLFKKELFKKERIKLLKDNVNFIINYNRMLDDKEKYLWMNFADDYQLYINFKTESAFKNWLRIIEDDLGKFGSKEQFLSKILLFFKKIHWIRIESIKDLSFRIDQAIEKNNKEKEMLLDYLSKYVKIDQKNQIYYCK